MYNRLFATFIAVEKFDNASVTVGWIHDRGIPLNVRYVEGLMIQYLVHGSVEPKPGVKNVVFNLDIFISLPQWNCQRTVGHVAALVEVRALLFT